MLSSLTSFLFNGSPAASHSIQCMDCYTKDAEDDWLLVDIQENNQQQQLAEREPIEKARVRTNGRPLSAININVPVHQGGGGQDGTPPPSSPSQMDGSWYVTPPPCFVAGEPISVEMSPLENLLIEHPSMSVYGARTGNISRKGKVHLAIPKEEGDENRDSVVRDIPAPPVLEQVTSTKRKSNPASHSRKGQVQSSSSTLAEKSGLLATESRQLVESRRQQYLGNQCKIKRSVSERYNRTKLFHSSCKHPRRRNKLSLGNSYANNNRKCC